MANNDQPHQIVASDARPVRHGGGRGEPTTPSDIRGIR